MEEKETLFIGYIDGTLDYEQSKRLAELLEENPSWKQELLDMKDLADCARPATMSPWTVDRRFAELIGTINGNKWAYWRSKIRRAVNYAAVAVVCIGLGIAASALLLRDRSEKNVLVQAHPGEMSEITLPDGTEITLKSSSRLSYDASRFGRRQRVVNLDGEAFFQVQSDKEHPFIVETAHGRVTVTGTVFNINDYSESSDYDVVLLEGKVSLDLKDGNGDKGHCIDLHPGERCVYDVASGKVNVEVIRKAEAGQKWDQNIIYLRNCTLGQIASRLEHYFSVKIDVSPEADTLGNFYGAFSLNDGVDSILKTLNYEESFTLDNPEPGYYIINPSSGSLYFLNPALQCCPDRFDIRT